jgi:hypothetical protein
MPVDQTTCFSRASKFASFVQGDNLGPASGSVVIDMTSGTTTSEAPVATGMCLAYCILWIQKIKVDRGYLVKDLPTLDATRLQRDYLTRHASSVMSNTLLLNLFGTQNDHGTVAALLTGKDNIKTSLAAWAKSGANFVVLALFGLNWGHAVALKLNRSTTGGWLNWSYPCAMFDPNVGQGMYDGHDNLASDLAALIAAYGIITSIRVQTISYDKVH